MKFYAEQKVQETRGYGKDRELKDTIQIDDEIHQQKRSGGLVIVLASLCLKCC